MVDNDITFDDMVKQQKAAHWLLNNDPFVHSFVMRLKAIDDYAAVALIAQFGDTVKARVENKAAEMTVTDHDRQFGYPPRETRDDPVLPHDITYRELNI